MSVTLYYIHDPMCSWCWGFRPTWDALKQALPGEVSLVNVAGGLARDSDQMMPVEMQQTIEGYWHTIQAQLGTAFNFDFWRLNTPRRSTYMACRAAIVAAQHGLEDAMINAIQQAYYLQAVNPSDIQVLVDLAAGLGVNAEQFHVDLLSAATEAELTRQMALARRLPIDGFPSLVLEIDQQVLSIQRDYLSMEVMLAQIHDAIKQYGR
ncbi:DsbA family protein [Oceanicoccus sagamiensis]|uniref:DsbA family protein n=1 Tax=Oceanicoccus sagamiensis TaxID=716816 RepID=A0A1X9NFF9_9GAMM|nr:DsbA family protein [Oceanicoccus sagamiensis]ARN75162.1 DsbA family protein [Oceanicoccus sagamiensis]